MEMLLMGACLALFGLAVTAAAFHAALPSEKEAPAIQPAAAKVAAPARFFAEPPPVWTQTPVEALLLHIENHIRLEQAAAESFLAAPHAASLHGRTTSPLVN